MVALITKNILLNIHSLLRFYIHKDLSYTKISVHHLLSHVWQILFLNLTFLAVHVSVDFAGQEAGFVDGSVGVMSDVQKRVTATADATDALSVSVIVLIHQLRKRLLQLISITTTHTHVTWSCTDKTE